MPRTHTWHARGCLLTVCSPPPLTPRQQTPTTGKTQRSGVSQLLPNTHTHTLQVGLLSPNHVTRVTADTLNNLILKSPQNWQTSVGLPFFRIEVGRLLDLTPRTRHPSTRTLTPSPRSVHRGQYASA